MPRFTVMVAQAQCTKGTLIIKNDVCNCHNHWKCTGNKQWCQKTFDWVSLDEREALPGGDYVSYVELDHVIKWYRKKTGIRKEGDRRVLSLLPRRTHEQGMCVSALVVYQAETASVAAGAPQPLSTSLGASSAIPQAAASTVAPPSASDSVAATGGSSSSSSVSS